MKIAKSLFAAAVLSASCIVSSLAQSTDTIVVFDGSRSMWGQINGKTKIEIARETLSSVLSDLPNDTRIGMIAYGHRERGSCSDIETVVPVGSADRSVKRMIDVANRLKPTGKTPLSDAVRRAAEELKFTENAATVVLVTDGVETCNADPCALGRELEQAGVNFTAHVVGFGLSRDEGRQVQCLAENTGGLYLSANDADELSDALRKTVQAQEIEVDDDDFDPPAVTTRNVRFIFRDTDGGPQLGIRQLSGIVETEDGTPVESGAFSLAYPEGSGNSAKANLKPGRYVALLRRSGERGSGYNVRFPFEVPEGEGDHLIEASLSGALTLNVFINPNLAYRKGDPFPTAKGGSRPRVNFAIYPVVDGEKAQEPVTTIAGVDNLTRPLPPGTYLVQGNLDSGTSAERLVEVKSGTPTEFDFSFDATRVYVDAREADGVPVRRQTSYWYDKVRSGRNYWLSGNSARNGDLVPFYLPTGRWLLNTGGEGYGNRRSELIVTVPGDYEDLRLRVGEGQTLSDADLKFLNDRGNGCLEFLKVRYVGCLVQRVDLSQAGSQPELEPAPAIAPAPSAAGDDVPADLAGLGGTALAFQNRDSGRKAYLVFDPALDEDAMIVLENDWCATGNCAGRRIKVPLRRVEIFRREAEGSAGNFFTDDFEFSYAIFSADNKVLFVKPNGQQSLRFDLTREIELAAANPGGAAPTGAAGSSGLEGLSGTALAFVDNQREPKLHVVFPPQNADDVIIVLSENWCGNAQCTADRVTVPYKRLNHLLEEGFKARSAKADGYRFDVSTFGTDKEIMVSGKGANRERLVFMDRIELGDGADQPKEAKTQPAAAGGNQVFGIFSLDRTGQPVEAVVNDYLHANACQRRPMVLHPDGTIAMKEFRDPQGPTDNPFKIVSSGQCRVFGERYECSLKGAGDGEAQFLAFKAKSLGNNHFALTIDGEGQPTIAASCFYPGGQMKANQIMPNGKPLAELMMERADGAASGMSYDADNNVRQGG